MDTTAQHKVETERPLSGPAQPAAPRLTLSGISKSFPGVRALHNVSLSLYPGQVTALIGENGAGKSTLVKIMTGIYQPDAGEISIDGEATTLHSAHAAFGHGITAIHQETVLFDDLSVAENIFLGHAPRTRFGTIDWRTMRKNAREVLETMRAGHIDADARLKDLGIANKHLVAVARAMSIDARIVIMDEPTAALSMKEIEELFLLIEFLKSEGKAVLFISHKFDEIYRIADRYTVFRDGEMVGDGLLKDAGQNEIVRMMVGRNVDHIFPQREPKIGAPVLSVSGLSHPTEFDDIGFELRKGEILGFYGLVGAGRSEVMQAISGITRTSRGTITLDGKPIAPKSAADSIKAGIVYVPEERGKQGVVIGMPIFQNVSLPSLMRTSKSGVLRLAEEFALARSYTERLDLRASSLSQDVGTLSGGNQQKVVIAKWLATAPKVIILDEPTKGIDIGSKAAVHGFMAELVAQGLSVIMVSSELPEILGMSDRVVVMREGRIAAVHDNKGLDAETLVRTAAGIAT
ncbi:sugar ABC transporter ATP-binding protein [Mesorhizobium sp. M4B.F.Ca.ET.215.01.1.1]|uniref:sugar ABC transporter ATP-binding protein n=1 Tax=unclassified Mesorhizobium TaxID=325217 RepID=UPI000FCB2861|nr:MULTISPECIES: sugar ABC transporter ATP-binding protein [unclassified Mesorhizobium]RUW28178.1 sugar ABC transporter ATP-binding protein [Mesorhizobium sp. M4B.F.Ca.ET.013.02.1.1]RVD45158.1 sugar ABC transporter ATP-binding protein [Mesorhizobium sp. M4B.F.Ca.ET.019.03.1.1]TGQ15083.1 sugar ABC transporter ATP-binding protein [Mesorhizobium sp. M4B.F.Ca.ET.215.01.1.1]TGQ48710.1 sugar ABC transporter ATP-binding protein [Mesorhizobium sp. M00.F.Ca.ET.220.01.1.1]TGR11150.1 sugar ABC transporte